MFNIALRSAPQILDCYTLLMLSLVVNLHLTAIMTNLKNNNLMIPEVQNLMKHSFFNILTDQTLQVNDQV